MFVSYLNNKKKKINFLFVQCFADIRFVLFVILIIQCPSISGLNTTVTSEIIQWPNISSFTCNDYFNNTDHKIDYVHGDVVISVISINPLPSQYVLNRVSDSIDLKVSLGKFINFVEQHQTTEMHFS